MAAFCEQSFDTPVSDQVKIVAASLKLDGLAEKRFASLEPPLRKKGSLTPQLTGQLSRQLLCADSIPKQNLESFRC